MPLVRQHTFLAGLAEANAMVRVPEDVTAIRPGDVVDVIFLSQRS